MTEQTYYKAKQARLVDVTQLRKETIQLVNQNCRLIGRYSGLSGVFATELIARSLMVTMKYYLFQINTSDSDIKSTISKKIEELAFSDSDGLCYPKRPGCDTDFSNQLTLLLWNIIEQHRLPLLDDRKRITLINTDLDYEDLEIELHEFKPKSKKLSGIRWYATFTISGNYEGRLISESQLTARDAARWVVKQAIMVYGPKKYINLAKRTYGVYKLFKKLVGYVSEERINPHIPNTKEALLKSETIKYLGDNLEEYVESKTINYAKNKLLENVNLVLKNK